MSVEDRNIKFKNKYLKYKNKYISLKNSSEQNGGFFGMTSNSNQKKDIVNQKKDIVSCEKILSPSVDLIANNFIKTIIDDDPRMFYALIKLYQKRYPNIYKTLYDPNEDQKIMFPYYDDKVSIIPFMKGCKNINLLRIAVGSSKPKMVKELLGLAPPEVWDKYDFRTADNYPMWTLNLNMRISELIEKTSTNKIGDEYKIKMEKQKEINSLLIQYNFKKRY